MDQTSLKEILSKLDTSAVTVDASGHISSSDPAVAAQLAELSKALRTAPLLQTAGDPNGVQCHCGSGGGE